MIEREGRNHVVHCDRCSAELEVESGGDFKEVLAEMRAQGWRSIASGGEWFNICPAHTATERAGGT